MKDIDRIFFSERIPVLIIKLGFRAYTGIDDKQKAQLVSGESGVCQLRCPRFSSRLYY